MALGRITRDRKKIARAPKNGRKGPRIETSIARTANGYTAVACLVQPGKSVTTGNNICGADGKGRTPQSALAKAVKSVSGVISRRNARYFNNMRGSKEWLKSQGVTFNE